jgi:anti-sigma B factor antagonist
VDLFRLERGGGPASFRLVGELDIASVPETEMELAQALDRDGELILDTTDLRFLDSQGLRMLIRLGERAQERGSSVKVLNCSSQVRRLLKIAVPQGVPGVEVSDVG